MPSASAKILIDVYRLILEEENLPSSFEVLEPSLLAAKRFSSDVVVYDPESDSQCNFCSSYLIGLHLACSHGDGCDDQLSSCSICLPCYVEGRRCQCQVMTFETTRRFTEMDAIRLAADKAYGSDSDR